MTKQELIESLANLSEEDLVEVVNASLDLRHEMAKKTFQPYRQIEAIHAYLESTKDNIATSRLLYALFREYKGWESTAKVYQKIKGASKGNPVQLPLRFPWGFQIQDRRFTDRLTDAQIQEAREQEWQFFEALDEVGASYIFKPILGEWVTEPPYYSPFSPEGFSPVAMPAYGAPPGGF